MVVLKNSPASLIHDSINLTLSLDIRQGRVKRRNETVAQSLVTVPVIPCRSTTQIRKNVR